MSATTVGEIIRRAKLVLQEVSTEGVRWTNGELIGWLNESYQAIVGVKPDASSVNTIVTCQAGTKQTIPADGDRLLEVVRNISTGLSVIKTTRQALDATRRRWHSEPEAPEIEHYIFDDADPKTFYVYPPAEAGLGIELIYSSVPTGHDGNLSVVESEVIKLADGFAPAMVDYILMRAYSKDAAHAANLNRAQLHANAYQTQLGLKAQGEMAFSPNTDQRGGSVQ